VEREMKAAEKGKGTAETLLPTSETVEPTMDSASIGAPVSDENLSSLVEQAEDTKEEELDADAVFANLGGAQTTSDEKAD
ncbi:MAG: hypothetical protein ACR2OW_03150, partial [Methyloligellaceae bacterium]